MLKDKCRSEKWEVYLFGQVVDMPAVVNDRCPMVQTVQKAVEFFGHDHRIYTVAVHLKGGRCPCCVGRSGSTVACGDSRVPTVAGRRAFLTLWRRR